MIATEPVCLGCGGGITPEEEGRCAFCRRDERGDDQLLSHDSRGWQPRVGGRRVPCGCGCGMTVVPEPVEVERSQPVVPFLRDTPRAERWNRETIIAAMHAWKERYGRQPRHDDWQRQGDDHPGGNRVVAVFGSWSEGIAAAGLEVKKGRAAGGWKPKPIAGTNGSQATGKAHEVGSGENAHPWADTFLELIDNGANEPIEISFRHEIPEHSRRLLKTLGVSYVISPTAPPCASACGHPDCREAHMDGREALQRMDAGDSVREPEVEPAAEPPKRRQKSPWDREKILAAIKRFAEEHGRPPVVNDWLKTDGDWPPPWRVQNVFGKWADAIEQAGFERPVHGRKRASVSSPSTEEAKPEAVPVDDDLRTAGLALISTAHAFLVALERKLG